MLKPSTIVDWNHVAFRLTNKLNAIASELDSLAKNSVSADCSILARDFLERFNLTLNGDYVCPDFDEISKVNDSLGSAIVRLRFCTPSERDKLLGDVMRIHSDLNMLLCLYGAFV